MPNINDTPVLDKIDFTVDTLQKTIKNQLQRRKNGAAIREAIRVSINEGRLIDHYRVEWLHDSSVRLVDLLTDIALEFDSEHPDDLCSSADLGDILTTTLARLKKAIED